MHIIARSALKKFWEKHPDAEQPLKAWFAEVNRAFWENPHEVKEQYRNVSILTGGRIVFQIAGNKYRLIVRTNYASKVVYIRFVGTHKEYDKIDAEKI